MSSTELALVASDPTAIERYDGPAVVRMCEEARDLLVQAVKERDIDWAKSLSDDARKVELIIRQRDLGEEAKAAAEELVLRATRSLGVVTRVGQDEGWVARERQGAGRPSAEKLDADGIQLIRPLSVFNHERTRADAYKMAEVDDEAFEEIIEAAKAEENLSRANVVRHVAQRKLAAIIDGIPVAVEIPEGMRVDSPRPRLDQSREAVDARVARARQLAQEGNTSHQIAKVLGLASSSTFSEFKKRHAIEIPADAVVGNATTVNAERIIEETIHQLASIAAGLNLIEDIESFDAAKRRDWREAIAPSLAAINAFQKGLIP